MNCFLPGWNKKWNSIPHQYTSPAQGTVHHRSSVPGCGKLSDQSPGQGGSVRKCVSPEGLSSPVVFQIISRGFQDILVDLGDNGAVFDTKGFQKAGSFGLSPAVVMNLNVQKGVHA